MNARTVQIVRSVSVIAATAAMVVGATYAATVGTPTLTGNTFSATQGLLISNGGDYGDTATGFDFGATPIGATGSAKQTFYLKDVTNNPTALAVSVTATSCGGFAGLDKTKVHVNIQKDSGGVKDVLTMASLCVPTPAALSALNAPELAGAGTSYKVWLTLDSGAITGGLNPLSNTFNLVFAGAE